MLEDPKGNFFIVVWDHAGLTGAREPHVDMSHHFDTELSCLSPDIWQKNPSSDYHSSEAIRSWYLPRARLYPGHKYSYQLLPITPRPSAEICRPEAYSGLPSWKIWCCYCCHTFYGVLLHQALSHWAASAVRSCPDFCTFHSSLRFLGISPGAHPTRAAGGKGSRALHPSQHTTQGHVSWVISIVLSIW